MVSRSMRAKRSSGWVDGGRLIFDHRYIIKNWASAPAILASFSTRGAAASLRAAPNRGCGRDSIRDDLASGDFGSQSPSWKELRVGTHKYSVNELLPAD